MVYAVVPCQGSRSGAVERGTRMTPQNPAEEMLNSYTESNIQHQRFYSSGNRQTVAIRKPRRTE